MEHKIARRYDLDWLRVLAILTVFVAHCGRFFDEGDWHVKNQVTYPALDIVGALFLTWLMPLLFVISGAAVFYSLRKGPARFVLDKVRRLLVPLVAGTLTHIIIDVYLEQVTHYRFFGSLIEFLPHYFDGLLFFGGNFAWMGLHLWYLEVLFVFSLVFLPLCWWLSTAPGRRLLLGIGAVLASPVGLYLLALPSTLLIPFLNPQHIFAGTRTWGGWSLPTYIFFFLAGFVIISHEATLDRIRRQRWVSLVAGMLFLGLTGATLAAQGEPLFGTAEYALQTVLHSLASWCSVLAILGLGMEHLNVYKPWLRYAGEAVLPFYILHQTIILCIGYFVVEWDMPDLLKYVVILVSSFAVTMGLYEFLVRRVNVLRFLFGMKPLPPQAVVGPAGQPGVQAR